jgi:hypothetical protein
MSKKNINIIIAVAVIVASLGIAYFLDLSTWNKIKSLEAQVTQTKASIAAKRSYYAVIDSKIEALNKAGWATKKKSIEVNFTSTPFFVPKINTFFQTMVLGSGMAMGGITSSTPTSVGAVPQAAQSSESVTKSSKASETAASTTSQSTGYFSQLRGPVKKTTVNLNVTGTYNAFSNLLTQFENQTRIITIKSVAVSPLGQDTSKGGVSNSLAFSVVLDIYSY